MDNTDLIKKTFETQMNKKVDSVQKFENVPNNHVFKIETESLPYIFKTYSSEWPEDGKLLFVDRTLTEHKIPHAKIFFYTHEDECFPNGYLIEECLPGTTADRIQLSDDETLQLFKKLALLVSQIHKIKMNGYGYTGNGISDYTTFSEFMYDVLKDNAENLTANGFIEAADLKKVNQTIYERLKCCDALPSVLCHGDLSTKNILIQSNGITLIDWDDVHSLCWVADIARLTFWMKIHYDKGFAAACRKAFLDNYETEHDINIFREIEETLHVWYGLDNLTFFTKGPICEKVKTLFQDSRNKCKM